MVHQITTVSTKGQLVIPAEMRAKLGIRPGMRLSVHRDGSRIVLEPVSEALVDKLHGVFKGGPSMEDALQKERRADKW